MQQTWAVIAPASANVIGKLASGIADDMLTTTLMACKCKILIASAMNTNMYENQVLQRNLDTLKEYGYEEIEPLSGRTCVWYYRKRENAGA